MLLGNYTQLNANPGTNVGGFTNPYAWMQTSNMMAFYNGEAVVQSTTDKSSFNNGYSPPFSWHLAPKAGGMALNATGTSTFSTNLIPQYLSTVDFTGEGSLTATVIGLGNIICALTGSNTFTSSITATGNLSINFSGSGTIVMNITGKGNISLDLSGSGNLSAGLSLFLNMLCDMTGTGFMHSDASLVVSMLCAMTGDSVMTASITGVKEMSASFTGTGNLSADITAFGNMILDLLGSGDLEADISAIADMSMDIVVTGTGLTTANVGPAVWAAIAAQNNVAGSMGNKLNSAASAGDPWTTELPGAYSDGEAGKILSQIETLVAAIPELQTLIDELHKVQGLNASAPAVTTPTEITAGDINISITGDGETETTLTRNP